MNDKTTPRLPAFLAKPKKGESKEDFKTRLARELQDRGLIPKTEDTTMTTTSKCPVCNDDGRSTPCRDCQTDLPQLSTAEIVVGCMASADHVRNLLSTPDLGSATAAMLDSAAARIAKLHDALAGIMSHDPDHECGVDCDMSEPCPLGETAHAVLNLGLKDRDR